MRWFVFATALIFVTANLVCVVFKPQKKFIWNRTASAPTGLYWLRDEPYQRGEWVIVSADSDPANWAESRGYIGHNWPMIKQIYGVPGDEICRDGAMILVNNQVVAEAKLNDSKGRELPGWSSCSELSSDQVFLLNAHPDSLDGRYFGPTDVSDLVGVAHKVRLF